MHSLAEAVLVKIAHLGLSGQSYPQPLSSAAVSGRADADVADIDARQQMGNCANLNIKSWCIGTF
jgi:hypothetical protein